MSSYCPMPCQLARAQWAGCCSLLYPARVGHLIQNQERCRNSNPGRTQSLECGIVRVVLLHRRRRKFDHKLHTSKPPCWILQQLNVHCFCAERKSSVVCSNHGLYRACCSCCCFPMRASCEHAGHRNNCGRTNLVSKSTFVVSERYVLCFETRIASYQARETVFVENSRRVSICCCCLPYGSYRPQSCWKMSMPLLELSPPFQMLFLPTILPLVGFLVDPSHLGLLDDVELGSPTCFRSSWSKFAILRCVFCSSFRVFSPPVQGCACMLSVHDHAGQVEGSFGEEEVFERKIATGTIMPRGEGCARPNS